MDFSKLFIVKHNSNIFKSGMIVHRINVKNNHLFLVEGIEDSSKKEWIMKYELYPVMTTEGFYHNKEFQAIANAFIQQKSIC